MHLSDWDHLPRGCVFVDKVPEGELQLVTNIGVLSFGADSTQKERVFGSYDFKVAYISAPRNVVSVGKLDLQVDIMKILVPREGWDHLDR